MELESLMEKGVDILAWADPFFPRSLYPRLSAKSDD